MNNNKDKNWGRYIREIREKETRLTQTKLAELSGIKRQLMQKIEAGRCKKENLNHIEAVAPHLNKTPMQIVAIIRGEIPIDDSKEHDSKEPSIERLIDDLEMNIINLKKKLKERVGRDIYVMLRHAQPIDKLCQAKHN